ncbi:MAG: hypothetical protein ABSF45_11345 [Terriglobia bacterium]|jgi:hypothetical protein
MLRRNFFSYLAAPWLLGCTAGSGSEKVGVLPSGRRQFVLGLYNLPKVADPWREAREAGCNLVHVAPSTQDFDRAREHILRTWVSLGSISEKNRTADESRIRGIVEQFGHDPALLFWETEDEPAYIWKSRKPRVSPEQIIATHDFVRGLDPTHPLYLNHAPVNLESTLRKYNAGAEIIATDIYPVIPHGIREMYALWPTGRQGDFLNATISQVGECTDKMRRVAGPSRAVFMVLQAFAWEDLRDKDRDPAMVLYPDRAQLKSMAYQAIIHGADGLLYWGLASAPPAASIWNDLRVVLSELAQMAPELAAPAQKISLRIEYHDTGHSLDRGIEWTARPSGKGLVLFTVNADLNPVEARFTLPAGFGSCEMVGADETITVSHGTMELSFAPFEAKALRIT